MKKIKKKGHYPANSGKSFSVREAKAGFSSLIERASEGEEIVITWHGKARAKLAPVKSEKKVFRVDRAWLTTMPVRKGKTAEAIIREDRDARG